MSDAEKTVPETLNFILANWYSGATLLALLVNRHTVIECNGETFPFSPRDLKDRDCTCGSTSGPVSSSGMPALICGATTPATGTDPCSARSLTSAETRP